MVFAISGIGILICSRVVGCNQVGFFFQLKGTRLFTTTHEVTVNLWIHVLSFKKTFKYTYENFHYLKTKAHKAF